MFSVKISLGRVPFLQNDENNFWRLTNNKHFVHPGLMAPVSFRIDTSSQSGPINFARERAGLALYGALEDAPILKPEHKEDFPFVIFHFSFAIYEFNFEGPLATLKS